MFRVKYISYNEKLTLKEKTTMNNKDLKPQGNKNDTELSKMIHNIIMAALALGSFAISGYFGILVFIFVAFYFFK